MIKKRILIPLIMILVTLFVTACGTPEPEIPEGDPPVVKLVDSARYRRGQTADISDLIISVTASGEYTLEYSVVAGGRAVEVTGTTFTVDENGAYTIYVKAIDTLERWTRERIAVPVDTYLTDFEDEAAYEASLYSFGNNYYNTGAALSLSDFTKNGQGKSLKLENTNHKNNNRTVMRIENKQQWHSLPHAKSVSYEIFVKVDAGVLAKMDQKGYDTSGKLAPAWMTPWIYGDTNEIAYAKPSTQWNAAKLNEWETVEITGIQYSGTDSKNSLYLQVFNVEHVWLLNSNWSGGTGFDVEIYIDNIIVKY